MQAFRIIFTRYKGHERVFSSPFFDTCKSFEQALDNAQAILRGMRAADPDGDYDIHSISSETPMPDDRVAVDGFRFTQ